MDPANLRDRKKRATREALSRAALDLALERGPENVRVDDIAACAGVSPRTYNNYFSSREEAICALGADRAQRIAAALQARPPGEPLATSITQVMVEQHAGPCEPDKEVIRLMTATPALRGEFLRTALAIERALADAIAERTGTGQTLFPRVLAAAVCGAARIATEHWLLPETRQPYAAVLRDALVQLDPLANTDPLTVKGITC